MNLRVLRTIDRYLGHLLLVLALPLAGLFANFFHAPAGNAKRHVFLKLKGGGSLLIAMPALLGMRRKDAEATFTLVCTSATLAYAQMLGVFDDYLIIDDATLETLVRTSFAALRQCFGSALFVDLEPNSRLAALFCGLSRAARRIGFVRGDEEYRARAYTASLSFNVYSPIYVYYDQIAEALHALPASIDESRDQLLRAIPMKDNPAPATRRTVGLSLFTSSFAPERMMPTDTWLALLTQKFDLTQTRLLLFGSSADKAAGDAFLDRLRKAAPAVEGINLCGERTLIETAAEMMHLDEFWSVDTGLLHMARLLGIKCRSFWGPTMPSQRLRPIPALNEEVLYRALPCSPCVHLPAPPCGGNNMCMKAMAEPIPETPPPLWL